MTEKDQLITDIAALLSTLVEQPQGYRVPASYVYLAFGSDMRRYERASGIAVQAGWIEATETTVTLTTVGRAKGEEINAALAQKE